MRQSPPTRCLAGLLVTAAAGTASAQGFVDAFDTIDPSWVTDRFEPNGFASIADPTPRATGNVLNIQIDDAQAAANRPGGQSGAFYDTQGRQRTLTNPITGDWSVSAEIYIDSSWAPANGNSRRSDVWMRDNNPNEPSAYYGIFGFSVFDVDDPFGTDPNNVEDFRFRLRAWDANAGGWQVVSLAAFNGFDSWNTLTMQSTGGVTEYLLNGSTVYTDFNTSQAGFGGIRTVYMQAFNFGTGGYDVQWDNLNVVPAPGAAAMLAVGGLAMARRRR